MAGEEQWLFRRTAQVQDAMVLLHPMQGKVLETKPKAKAKGGKSAKRAPKAKAKSRAGGGDGVGGESLLSEPSKLEDSVCINIDGTTVARPKYFIDCLLGAIRTSLLSGRQIYGAPAQTKQVDGTNAILGQNKEGKTVVYEEHDVPILRLSVHIGMLFAFNQTANIGGKIHTRWSTCRPAIQFLALKMYREAPCS